MLGALVHCIAAPREEESALERKRSFTRRYALRPLTHGLSAYRRRPNRPLQLALRSPPRREVPAAHRGYGPGALDDGRHRGHPRRNALARARLGRARILSVAILGAARRDRAPPARPRSRLSLLYDPRGTRRPARSRTARPAAVPDQQPMARRRAATRRQAVCDPPQGAARRGDRDRRPRSGP